ncbi:MAG: OmpH family outer membrane protein [Planctomycetes bacterium]|nr:OmpH family outer membrane protein [Planctomycetota bacterium]
MIRTRAVAAVPVALLVAATAALAPLGGRSTDARRAPDDLAGRVGIVRMDALSEAYRGTQARLTELEGLRREAQREIDELNQQLKAAQTALESLTEGTDEYLEASFAYRLKGMQAEERAKYWDARLSERRLSLGIELFAEIERGVAAFAQQKGLQLVFRVPPMPRDLPGKREANERKELIYFDAALDVTSDCIAFLKTWH